MLPQWRLRLDLPKPQALFALSSPSKAGLIRVNLDDIPLTPPTSHQHCTHSTSTPHSVHSPHIFRGNVYTPNTFYKKHRYFANSPVSNFFQKFH